MVRYGLLGGAALEMEIGVEGRLLGVIFEDHQGGFGLVVGGREQLRLGAMLIGVWLLRGRGDSR